MKTVSENDVRRAVGFFKQNMKAEAEDIERRVMLLVMGDYQKPGVLPSEAAKKVRTKNLEAYARMTGFDLDSAVAEAVKKITDKKEQEDSVRLDTRDGACRAWFELYEPHGHNTHGFYDKVQKALRQQFRHVTFMGYWPKTNQGAFRLSIYPSPPDAESFPYDDAAEEITHVMRYVRAPDGEVEFGVFTEDCSERGVISIVLTKQQARVDFTRYSHTKTQFTGALKDALKFIVSHHCLGDGHG